MTGYFLQASDCELEGKTHEWSYRTETKKWEHYGFGEMLLRECVHCNVKQFVEFLCPDGIVKFLNGVPEVSVSFHSPLEHEEPSSKTCLCSCCGRPL